MHRGFERTAHFGGTHPHHFGDFFGRGFALHRLLEFVGRAFDLTDGFSHVDGQANSPALVCNRTRDGLTDPPCSIRGELVSFGVIKLLNRTHQADIAFLDQIHHSQAIRRVFFGD